MSSTGRARLGFQDPSTQTRAALRLAQHSDSRALRLPAGEVKDPDTDAVGRFQCP
jgi:hypothetical protein